MGDNDYIRKGVELADGWHVTTGTDEFMIIGPHFSHSPPTQVMLDALAAQLVRQVDALKDYVVHVEPEKAILCHVHYSATGFPAHRMKEAGEGPDRTMNTIKAIVDSKVLASD